MDDEKHNNLCDEFYKLLLSEFRYKEIMCLVDSDKYKDIFTWHNKTYTCDPIMILYDKMLLDGIITYIITTRKIAIQYIYNRLYNIITKFLHSNTHIKTYFSFYTASEITFIISEPIYGSSIVYKIKFRYTLLFHCAINNNMKLFNYILNYICIHDISSIIPSDMKVIYNYNTIYSINPNAFNLVNAHEELLIFKRSLRYCWITACIT